MRRAGGGTHFKAGVPTRLSKVVRYLRPMSNLYQGLILVGPSFDSNRPTLFLYYSRVRPDILCLRLVPVPYTKV